MNPVIQALLLSFALGALLGAAPTWLIMKYRALWTNRGKALAITLPETPGTWAEAHWIDPKAGKIERPSNEHDAIKGEKDLILPAGPAAYQLRGALRGPLHILTTYGANLTAPSKLEAQERVEKEAIAEWVKNYKRLPKDDEAKKEGAWHRFLAEAITKAKATAQDFTVWDPLRYWKATRENDMQDLRNSTGKHSETPWYAFLILVGLGFMLLILLGLGGIIYTKVLPLLEAQAQAIITLWWG